jgi:broad specificity phosphatase PhoE
MNATPLKLADEAILAKFIRDHGPQCLIIARHGETEWNVAGRLQGQRDVSLNKSGRCQALAAGRILRSVPLIQIYVSTLQRCQQTAHSIAEENIGRPDMVSSALLKETALGVLEGELKDRQSTAELTRHYRNFSRDEINYQVPGGENLIDVYTRVQQFFSDHGSCLTEHNVRLIVGHRNMNKMILKHLLGLSFDEGFQVEQEHQRIYLYFCHSKELWSCWVETTGARLTRGYATSAGNSYA